MVNQTEQPIESTEAPAESGNTTTDITEEEAIQKVMLYLEKEGYIG